MKRDVLLAFVLLLVGFFTYFQLHVRPTLGLKSNQGPVLFDHSIQEPDDLQETQIALIQNEAMTSEAETQQALLAQTFSEKDFVESLSKIQKKLDDMDFDFNEMGKELRKKLKASKDGKLTQEEMLALLPEEVAGDFEELMQIVSESSTEQ